jgi:hypothetical protein
MPFSRQGKAYPVTARSSLERDLGLDSLINVELKQRIGKGRRRACNAEAATIIKIEAGKQAPRRRLCGEFAPSANSPEHQSIIAAS